MHFKKFYHYTFYKLFNFYEKTPFWGAKWLSDWKALFSMMVLEIWLLLSSLIYYKVYTKRDFIAENLMVPVLIIAAIIFSLVKYFVFEYQNKWKDYIREFNKYSKKKNRIGGIIVWAIILLIIANLIFAFYLMSQIDWKQYRLK